MKKTHDANIGGTLFHVEEDAYARLEAYLTSIATYFASYEDSADIVADIESRIAEQLQQTGPPSRIISTTEVEHVIATMGRVDQFAPESVASAPSEDGEATPATLAEPSDPSSDTGATDAAPDTPPSKGFSPRQFYRDTDRGLIAGVAAGLAAYLSVPVILVRVLMVAPILSRGTRELMFPIVFVYLLVWLIAPVAKTTTDKLRMRGNPVTLAAVEQGVRDRVAALAPGTRNVLSSAISAIGALIRAIVVLAARAALLAVAVGAIFTVLVCTVLLVMMLVNPNAIPSPSEITRFYDGLGASYSPFVFAAYLVCAIPFVLISMVAVAILRKQRRISLRWSLSCGGVWVAALLVVVGLWATVYPASRKSAQRPPCVIDGIPCALIDSGYVRHDSLLDGPRRMVRP